MIKARVMSKSDIRTWNNARGEGKLFSMDLCDDSGEIRATAFKNECDKFYDMIQVKQYLSFFWYQIKGPVCQSYFVKKSINSSKPGEMRVNSPKSSQ